MKNMAVNLILHSVDQKWIVLLTAVIYLFILKAFLQWQH